MYKFESEDSRNWTRKQVKGYLIDEDGPFCQICRTEFQPEEFDEVEIDHVVPRSMGGEDIITNLQLAHPHCNRQKSNLFRSMPKERKNPQLGLFEKPFKVPMKRGKAKPVQYHFPFPK